MSQLNLDFSNIKLNLDGAQPDIKTDVLTQGIMNIMGAYPSWLQEQRATTPEYATDQAAVEAYLADPATKAAMQKVIADSIDFSGVSEQIQQQLQEQLSQQLQAQLLPTFCSYFAAAARAAFRRYAVVYANSNDAGHDAIRNSDSKPSLIRDDYLYVHPFGKYVKSYGH